MGFTSKNNSTLRVKRHAWGHKPWQLKIGDVGVGNGDHDTAARSRFAVRPRGRDRHRMKIVKGECRVTPHYGDYVAATRISTAAAGPATRSVSGSVYNRVANSLTGGISQ